MSTGPLDGDGSICLDSRSIGRRLEGKILSSELVGKGVLEDLSSNQPVQACTAAYTTKKTHGGQSYL